jgi:hypothetical protein
MKVRIRKRLIAMINRVTVERNYWEAKIEAAREGKMFIRNERYERRKNKFTHINRHQ